MFMALLAQVQPQWADFTPALALLLPFTIVSVRCPALNEQDRTSPTLWVEMKQKEKVLSTQSMVLKCIDPGECVSMKSPLMNFGTLDKMPA